MTVEQIAEANPICLVGSSTNTAPAGYKQTELGMIPEDWCVSPIGQRHILATGTTPPTANTANYGDRYLFVSPADLGEAKYVLKAEKRLSDRGFKLARQYPAGSTLFTCIGSTIGKTGLSREILTSNQQINAIFPSDDSDPEFVYYAVTHIAPRVKALAGQQAVPLVNKSEFGETLYCYPSSKIEQTAIANTLSDVDALIQELEKLIAKKQAIKTATMQQLLTGRTRLPPFGFEKSAHHPDGRKKGYKPSELGEIPEDWEVADVGSLCDLLTGYPFPSNKYSSTGVRLLRGSNVKRGCTDWSEDITQYWPEKTGAVAQYELQVGDIVISMDGSLVGRSFAELSEKDLPALLLQRVARLRSSGIEQGFLKEWICSKFFTEHCDSVKTVTAIPHISPLDIRSFKLLLPPSAEEQTIIANILSDMDGELEGLDQRLTKTRQIKQGMMQELLTGKIRLVNPAGAA